MRRSMSLLLVAFVLLAFAYSMVVPPFETPDEVYHYAFARHLAEGNGLPVQSPDASGPWEQEGSQAPLYYMLAGALTRLVPQEDFAALATRNPRANIGDPLYPGNKNFMLYSAAKHPLVGSNLALHIGRWLSLLLGIATVLGTYGLTRAAYGAGSRTPLLAAALAATIPQFLFLSGSMTNDALVTAASAATVFWLARLLARPAEEPVSWREWLLLGLLLAVAALSKLQGLGLFVLAALVCAGMAWQRRDWRLPLRALLPAGLPPLLLAGWWYLRNIRLYGDWTGLHALLELNGRRTGSFDLADWWQEFRGLRYSFWGLFGWFNILLPDWVYTVLDVATTLALVGAVAAIVLRWRRGHTPGRDGMMRVLLMALAWSVMSFALLVYWTIVATGSQGRLLFPALSALVFLFVVGVEFWVDLLPTTARRGAQTAVWGVLFALLAGSSLYALGFLLPRSYHAGPPVTEMPASAAPLSIRYGDGEPIDLLGVDIPERRYRPGDDVPVTLYLRAESALAADYELYLQLLDEDGAEIANITSHPGWGRRPTTLWEPGALYADSYLLRITGGVDWRSPLLARVYTGFVDPATSGAGNFPLPARDASGAQVTPFVATVTVSPPGTPDPESLGMSPAGAQFGGVVELKGACIDMNVQAGEATVRLLYEALGTPATDYTAFVHVLDGTGQRAAGFDRAPAGERFPTRAWRHGDRIAADFVLSLPEIGAGTEWMVWTGLYETSSAGALRLPVTEGAGMASGDGQVAIGPLVDTCRDAP